MDKRDIDIVKHIKQHCIDTAEAVVRFGNSYDIFTKDVHYKNTVSMSLMQIGELSTGLSEEFKDSTRSHVQWGLIKGMRNRFAHGYDTMGEDYIWETATKDIPELVVFCDEILNQEKSVPRRSIDEIEKTSREKATKLNEERNKDITPNKSKKKDIEIE